MLEPWAAQPPEVTTLKFRASLGGAGWIAQAAAWEAHAAALAAQGAILAQQVAQATLNWGGVSSVRFNASMPRMFQWITHMSVIAQREALRAGRIAAAHAKAQASLTPLSIIAANRAAAAAARATTPLLAATGGAIGGATAGVGGALATIPAAGAGGIAAGSAGTAAGTAVGTAANPVAAQLDAEYARMWAHNTAVLELYEAEVLAASTLITVEPPPKIVDTTAAESTSLESKMKEIEQALQRPVMEAKEKTFQNDLLNSMGNGVNKETLTARMMNIAQQELSEDAYNAIKNHITPDYEMESGVNYNALQYDTGIGYPLSAFGGENYVAAMNTAQTLPAFAGAVGSIPQQVMPGMATQSTQSMVGGRGGFFPPQVREQENKNGVKKIKLFDKVEEEEDFSQRPLFYNVDWDAPMKEEGEELKYVIPVEDM